MKLTKESLREIIKEVLAETDAHPQILKKNKQDQLTLALFKNLTKQPQNL